MEIHSFNINEYKFQKNFNMKMKYAITQKDDVPTKPDHSQT